MKITKVYSIYCSAIREYVTYDALADEYKVFGTRVKSKDFESDIKDVLDFIQAMKSKSN